MLSLIRCEFDKLKRRKFILISLLFSIAFPIPFSFYIQSSEVLSKFVDARDAFDGLYKASVADGIQFLLPAILGVIASILFFMERDNDTFKNLQAIPITSTQMVLTKISVLFIFAMIFSLLTTFVVIISGYLIPELEVYDVGYKIFLSIILGLFITAGSLPIVVIITLFSRNYIFSTLLSIFYTVFNMGVLSLYNVIPKYIMWILPTPLTTFWATGNMIRHGININLEEITKGMIPSTSKACIILVAIALISFLLIDQLYKRRID